MSSPADGAGVPPRRDDTDSVTPTSRARSPAPSHPLFVTRKFPPSVGGMETLAAEVWAALRTTPGSSLLAHGGANRALPWWLPMAIVRTGWRLVTRRVDLVVAGDAVTFAALWPVARLLRRPIVVTVMGLDLIYPSRWYRAILRLLLPRATRVLAISSATAAAAEAIGVPADRLAVLRIGLRPSRDGAAHRAAAPRSGTDDRPVLATVGRLVPRKGHAWFIANVLPRLRAHPVYVVVGDGPERDAITVAAEQHGVAADVQVLGRVDDAQRWKVLAGADAFVQPNIRVPGDMEGFGLVTLEAAHYDVPVFAADLEGLRDAVDDGITGTLVRSGDAEAWITTLDAALSDRDALARRGRDRGREARARRGPDALTASLLSELAAATGR